MSDKQSHQMKWILFWAFLILFVLSVLGTMGIVFFGFGTPTSDERNWLVKALIGEIASAIVVLFYSIFNLKKGCANSEIKMAGDCCEEDQKMISIIEDLRTELINKDHQIDALKTDIIKYDSLRNKVLAILSRNDTFSVNRIAIEIHPNGYRNDDALAILDVIGILLSEGLIKGSRYSENYELVKKY